MPVAPTLRAAVRREARRAARARARRARPRPDRHHACRVRSSRAARCRRWRSTRCSTRLANLRPDEPRWEGRDRIVISHGHTSPGAYAALAAAGFFPAEEFVAHFRQAGSVFEGHVERAVPGIEWSSGNLGQGLSAGVGFALGARLTGAEWHTFVAMSDGEQQKGQVGEARRLAVKERLGNLTAVVDWNHIQISGHTDDVMPVPLAAGLGGRRLARARSATATTSPRCTRRSPMRSTTGFPPSCSRTPSSARACRSWRTCPSSTGAA